MVTADALPTVQIDGVVWAQVIIGNVVYAGGEFTSARPQGSERGINETPRRNLLAYDITTGELIARFVPGDFNGAVRALAVSPDKKTLYVGGRFTKVGDSDRLRFAALNVSTGSLKSLSPSFNGRINALAVDSKTVYAAGAFSSVNGRVRARIAAVKATNGELKSWNSKANAEVHSLLLTSGSKLLIVGGMFTKLNSTGASGSGAVSPTTGKTKTWKVNKIIKNGASSSSILSLATDGATVYAAAYAYGTGNFEGVYAASSKDGALRWLQDCHGDVYGVAPIGDVVYSVGHAHYCSNIGGFPDTLPRSAWYHALAVSKAASGTVAKNGQTSSKTYTNFEGKPAPALLNWFPNLAEGIFTGMSQAAWSVVGNSAYISLGGEFPKVNGVAQEGLVRMAISRIAPGKTGPEGKAGSEGYNNSLALAVNTQTDGRVALEWGQLWDRDDLALTYQLTRNGIVIDTRKTSVPFWKRSPMKYIDETASSDPSSMLEYQVRVFDRDNNTAVSRAVSVARPSLPSNDHDATPTPSPVRSLATNPSSPSSSPGKTVPSELPSTTSEPSATSVPKDVSEPSLTADPIVRP